MNGSCCGVLVLGFGSGDNGSGYRDMEGFGITQIKSKRTRKTKRTLGSHREHMSCSQYFLHHVMDMGSSKIRVPFWHP